jgi:hypothetical protein
MFNILIILPKRGYMKNSLFTLVALVSFASSYSSENTNCQDVASYAIVGGVVCSLANGVPPICAPVICCAGVALAKVITEEPKKTIIIQSQPSVQQLYTEQRTNKANKDYKKTHPGYLVEARTGSKFKRD